MITIFSKATFVVTAVVAVFFVLSATGCTPAQLEKAKSFTEKAKSAVKAGKAIKDAVDEKDPSRLSDIDLSSFTDDPDEKQHAEWLELYNVNEEAVQTHCYVSQNKDLCGRALYVQANLKDALQCMDARIDEKRSCERQKQSDSGYVCDAPRTCFLGR